MGQRYLSLKGNLFTWRGKSTQGVNDRGERRWLKLENCYVHGDGTEIRTFPGFFKILDLREDYNSNGYARYVNDLLLPIYNDTPAEIGRAHV